MTMLKTRTREWLKARPQTLALAFLFVMTVSAAAPMVVTATGASGYNGP